MRHPGTPILALLTVLLALVVNGQVHAQTSSSNAITADHPWARATPAGLKIGAAYVTLINTGTSSDQLQGATTPVADKVQFHRATEENGVARMRELRTVEVAPGGKVTFSPGDLHMMLLGLKQPLKEGQSFPLTLDFEKAGKIEVTVSVANVGAMNSGELAPMTHGADGAISK